ncbi:hypothetical protein ACWIUD_09555 [Helicobacter sp. 23-1044]
MFCHSERVKRAKNLKKTPSLRENERMRILVAIHQDSANQMRKTQNLLPLRHCEAV